MTDLAATLAGLIALGTLGSSGFFHAQGTRLLREALTRHAIWPFGLTRFVARGITALELSVSASGLAALVALDIGSAPLLRYTLLAASLLYLSFFAYTAYLWCTRSDMPCGCSPTCDEINFGTLIRSGTLLISAVFAVIFTENIMSVATADIRLSVVAPASLAVGVALWSLPAALHDPMKARLVQAVLVR